MMELKSLHFLRVSLQLVSRVLTKLTAFFAQCSPLEVRTFSCEETLCKIQARRLSFGLLFFAAALVVAAAYLTFVWA